MVKKRNIHLDMIHKIAKRAMLRIFDKKLITKKLYKTIMFHVVTEFYNSVKINSIKEVTLSRLF